MGDGNSFSGDRAPLAVDLLVDCFDKFLTRLRFAGGAVTAASLSGPSEELEDEFEERDGVESDGYEFALDDERTNGRPVGLGGFASDVCIIWDL
jgi:hypothetical protein